MTLQHIQTFLVLADRARLAGLIKFEEFVPVTEATTAANALLNQAAQPTPEEAPAEAATANAK